VARVAPERERGRAGEGDVREGGTGREREGFGDGATDGQGPPGRRRRF
jgi:hypothetical protein